MITFVSYNTDLLYLELQLCTIAQFWLYLPVFDQYEYQLCGLVSNTRIGYFLRNVDRNMYTLYIIVFYVQL